MDPDSIAASANLRVANRRALADTGLPCSIPGPISNP
jgi:hypothetical protein